MAQVITIAGERLFALKAQNNEQLDVDTFIFANVPGQDPNATIDRNEGLPPVGQIVHQQIVQQVGRVNDNVVIYSTVMDSLTGPFDFNWVGLYSSVNQTLIAVSHIPNVSKTVTVPGAAGNTLNRNFGIEYSGIADLTGITVAPETWQLDFTARLSGMDELTRQLAADMNGKDWFIGDGFKVEPRSTANTFKVTPGAGYVSGLRIELKQDHILTLQSYPQFVYVDAWFDGDASSQWKPKTAFTVTNGEMDDYIDVNGKQHYMFKLARITAANSVEDLRNTNGVRQALEKRLITFTKIQDMVSYKYHQVGNSYSVIGLGDFAKFFQVTTSATSPGAVNLGDGLYAGELYVVNKQTKCKTLAGLVAGIDHFGFTMNLDFLASKNAIVETAFHNLLMTNDSPGGGAKYRIRTSEDFLAAGEKVDGGSIGGAIYGANHYIGVGTDYVAEYIKEKGCFDAEALGFYSGQFGGVDFSVATTVFNHILDLAVEDGGCPIILSERQNYYYNDEYGDKDNIADRICIIGQSCPSMDYDPNNPRNYDRLKGGTRIRGRMSLWAKSGYFRDFGIDGGNEATGGWSYNYDGFKCINVDTATARDMKWQNIIALGKSHDTPSHALIASGYRRMRINDCQGYSTWYGLSVDARDTVIQTFIGGNNGRNVVNAKSHKAVGVSGNKYNTNMVIQGVSGFNPKTELGEYIGSSIVAVEADGNQLERLVITGVVGEGCRSLIGLAPFNGAVITSVTISDCSGADFDDDTIANGGSDYAAIFSRAGYGGGYIRTLNINNVQLTNVKYRAAKFENITFLNIENWQANTGIGGIDIADSVNTDFVHITNSVVSAMIDNMTLTNSFGLTSGTGQGAIKWDNSAVNNRKGNRMLCINTGTGAPV
jgi:hypothetical protein